MIRKVTMADANGTVEAAVGDTIEIILPESPTSGFAWASQTECAEVRLESEERVHAAHPPGAQGEHHFRFRVEAAGRAELRFVLDRSWEKAKRAATFRVSVAAK
jgi:predicted secreted protein